MSLALEAIKDIVIYFHNLQEKIKLILIKIQHEKEHQITLAGYLYVNWYDDFLMFRNYENFSCINVLIIPGGQLFSLSKCFLLFFLFS